MRKTIFILYVFFSIFFPAFTFADTHESQKLLFDHSGANDHLLIINKVDNNDSALLFSQKSKKISILNIKNNTIVKSFFVSELADTTLIKKMIINEKQNHIYMLGVDENLINFYRVDLENEKLKKLLVNDSDAGSGVKYYEGMEMAFLSDNVIRTNNPANNVMFDIATDSFDCADDAICNLDISASKIFLPFAGVSIQSLSLNKLFLLTQNQEANIYAIDFQSQRSDLLASLGSRKGGKPLFLNLEKGNEYPLLIVGNPVDSEIVIYKYNADYKALDVISKTNIPGNDNRLASKYMIAGSDNLLRFLVYDDNERKLYTFSFIDGVINLLAIEEKNIQEMDVTSDGQSYIAILDSGDVYKYSLLNAKAEVSQEEKVFKERFEAAGISYFKWNEFLDPIDLNGGCKKESYFPPRRSWCNAIETAKMMDEFRERLSDKFGKDTKVFIGEINNSCVDKRISPYNDFLSLSFNANTGGARDWISLLKKMLDEGFYSGEVDEKNGQVRLIITPSENLWVYVGEENEEAGFESRYFDLNVKSIYSSRTRDLSIKGGGILPLNRMSLRAMPPVKIKGNWIFGEKLSSLTQYHSFYVEDSKKIDSGDAGLYRYWAGGKVSNKKNTSKNDWLVIVRSSSKIEEIKSAFEVLSNEYPDFPLAVYKDPFGKYAIVIGAKLSQLEAKYLVLEAKCAGISDEAYMWIPVGWTKLNF